MNQIVSAFRGVFANRDLRRVELAAVGSELAAFSYLVVLAVVAYDTSGTGGVGILMLTRMAAAAITTPFTSAFADRFARKRVMVISNLISAALILVIAAAVSSGIGLVGLCVLASVAAIATSVFRPAQAALLPTLANTPEQLTTLRTPCPPPSRESRSSSGRVSAAFCSGSAAPHRCSCSPPPAFCGRRRW